MTLIDKRKRQGHAMKIILMGTAFAPHSYGDWHILSAVDVERPEAPAPCAPGSAAAVSGFTKLPTWLADDHHYVRTSKALDEFRRILADFIEVNRSTIGARKVVINLNGKTQPLPFDYVKAIWDVFRQKAFHDPIEVLVFTSLSR